MPEGDTLFRTAAGLRPHLVGRVVTAARGRVPGPQIGRVVGATVTAVDAVGKNLLVRFDTGVELRTHLRMYGSWHRYWPGEPWRRPAGRAVLVLEVPDAVAVCFDAPVVELLETRAEHLHPPLAELGPDATADGFDRDEALRRLRAPARRGAHRRPRRSSTSGPSPASATSTRARSSSSSESTRSRAWTSYPTRRWAGSSTGPAPCSWPTARRSPA